MTSTLTSSTSATVLPPPRFDARRDPRVGDWVVVVPSRWASIMNAAAPHPPPEHRRRMGHHAKWFWYVHVSGGVIFPHDEPPAVFGGTDYELYTDVATSRLMYRHRWMSPMTHPPTDDPAVMGRADGHVLPGWVGELQAEWYAVLDFLEEKAAHERSQEAQREALAKRGLDPFTGAGPWQPMLP
jgi:hypothetical protein